MIQETRRRPPSILICAIPLLSFLLVGTATGHGGRLLVRLEGDLAGPIPPTVTVSGPDLEEARTLDALSLAAGEVLFEGLEPGSYRITISGVGAADPLKRATAPGSVVEAGVHEGLTTVVRARIDVSQLTLAPFRPDPFGIEDAWDAGWIEALAGDGEEGPLAAETSPVALSQQSVDGLDLIGTGFRHTVWVRGASMVRSLRTPLGLSPASEEAAARRILSRFGAPIIEAEGALGSRGRNSYEGGLGRSYPTLPWAPRFIFSIRGLDYGDAAPSVFSGGEKLPHNDLSGLDLFTRIEGRPAQSTHLTALLYGGGVQRDHFVEAFRHDVSHAPREDRASIEGGVRALHRRGANLQLLGEIDLQRTYVATGDGSYFDDISSYVRAVGAEGAVVDNGLYWQGDTVVDGNTVAGHAYNYFRRNVQVDLLARLEAWQGGGTARRSGVGVFFRRGTYRSYEHLDPINSDIAVDPDRQAIGYDDLGERHSDAAGHEPGHPSTLAAFGTVRREVPSVGGEMEIGLRLTRFASGQEPLRDLSDPFGGDESGEQLMLADPVARTTIDPRIAYTRSIGPRWRLWASGGMETRIPLSEALYYSVPFLTSTALLAESGEDARTIIGNPGLKPEQVMGALIGVGAELNPELRIRSGVEGRWTENAITPRVYPGSDGRLAFYVNEGTRDLIDLFVRAEWEPSARFGARLAYDLSRARTQTVEPELLDAARYVDGPLPSFLSQREGLMPIVPAVQTGEAGSYYPSVHDRRHRFSLAIVARPAGDLIGESGRILFENLEASALIRASSGGRFSWTTIYAAGLVGQDPPADPPTVLTDRDLGDGRVPWTGQLDLRVAKGVAFPGGELQIWFEMTNVTDRRNTVRVYQATGEGEDDAALGTRLIPEDLSEREGFAEEYTSRIQDPENYGEPRLMRAGLRLLLP